jgi:GTPase SAR1 family protein
MQRRNKKVNIVLVGDSKSGKSEFLQKYYANCGDNGVSRTLGLDFITFDYKSARGELVSVIMWDTAG